MTARSSMQTSVPPWYREPWLWIVAAGPIAVVIAGIITTVIAYSTADGLVADDYYKRGLTINRSLARDRRADELGLTGEMRIESAMHRARIELSARDPHRVFPPSVTIKLIHSICAADDRVATLASIGKGVFEGSLDLAPAGLAPSRVLIESPEWRLVGTVRPAVEIVKLRPASDPDSALTH